MRLFFVLAVLAAACSFPAVGQVDEVSLHARRAQAAIHQNDTDVALRELEALLRLEPGNINALGSLGMVEFTRRNYARAAGHFEAALSRSPSLWSARAFLGMCEIRLGRLDHGRTLLEAAYPHITDRNLHTQAGLDLVRSFAEAGTLDKAESILETLRQLDPDNPEVLYSVYRVHSEVAAGALRKLSLLDADSVWVHEILAQNFMAQEQYPSAVQEYRKALVRDARTPGLHYQLGEALFAEARTEENRKAAEKEFLAELEINPVDADSLGKLGQIALERSDMPTARGYLMRALELRPGLAEAHADLARVLSWDGNTKGAIEHLEAAAKLAPNTKNTHYRLAQLYKAAGRADEAEREFNLYRKLSTAESGPQP